MNEDVKGEEYEAAKPFATGSKSRTESTTTGIRQQSSGHEPECRCTCSDDTCGFICDCAVIRAAYQRGRMDQSVVDMDAAVINQNKAYNKGQRVALAGAVQRVKALYGPVPGAYVHEDRVIAAINGGDND